jgi:alkylhydroperoxidase family enzyme
VQAFSYTQSPYKIRENLGQAYREFWVRLAKPGSWWTGAQRVAIAQESRNAVNCEFCARRKQALSPYSFAGEHEHDGRLQPVAVDAVHRIVTDQCRITQSYIQNNQAEGLSKEQYVELAGIVVVTFSIDEFNRALGLPLEPLPEPGDGEPTHYRPAHAVEGTGFVPMIPANANDGDEADLWPEGVDANVLRAFSVVPDAVRDWLQMGNAQYLSMAGMEIFAGDTGRSIDRMQIELVAARVSSINECFY